jgi:hypothetical protein
VDGAGYYAKQARSRQKFETGPARRSQRRPLAVKTFPFNLLNLAHAYAEALHHQFARLGYFDLVILRLHKGEKNLLTVFLGEFFVVVILIHANPLLV